MGMSKENKGMRIIGIGLLLILIVIVNKRLSIICRAEEESKHTYLTSEEKEYQASHEKVCIGIYPNDYPLSGIDRKTGQASGITIELLEMISRRSGLQFEYVPIKEDMEPMKALSEENCDLIAGFPCTKNYVVNGSIQRLSALADEEVIAVGKKGSEYQQADELTIALPAMCRMLAGSIKQQFPNSHIQLYTSNEKCMDAVVYQQADLMFQNSYVAGYLLQKPFYEELEGIPSYKVNAGINIAGLATTDKELYTMIERTIATLDKNEINQIIINYTISNPYQMGLTDFLYKYGRSICIAMIFLVVCGVIVGDLYNQKKDTIHKLEISNQQLKEAVYRSEIDAMTGLYNKTTLEKLCIQQMKEKINCEYYFFIVDIDNFKMINDTYGHQTGDYVLCKIADELKKVLGEKSVIGRIGGDEFAILYDASITRKKPEEVAEKLCKKLRILNHGSDLSEVSCSIGIAKIPKENICFEDLFRQADGALYEVKKDGKDGFKVG